MRLVTRADFDGIVCGSLITLMEEVDSYLFVEPKFMQDGVVDVRPGDAIANLPYHPNCTLWFDHHITNANAWPRHLGRESGMAERSQASEPPSLVVGKGGFALAPSAARVVYDYYLLRERERRNEERLKLLESGRWKTLLDETDKIDAGQLTPEDVLRPQGYVLISMTIDGVRPQDEAYWLRLIELLRDATLSEILRQAEVQRRCDAILAAQEKLKTILLERSALMGNVIFVDLRGLKEIPDGNRFLLYTLFPTGNISLKVADDPQRPGTTAVSVGYNIFHPTSRINVGALMEKYGGGGHRVVGSCRVPNNEAEKAIAEILGAIKE